MYRVHSKSATHQTAITRWRPSPAFYTTVVLTEDVLQHHGLQGRAQNNVTSATAQGWMSRKVQRAVTRSVRRTCVLEIVYVIVIIPISARQDRLRMDVVQTSSSGRSRHLPKLVPPVAMLRLARIDQG